jgi:hypothetical protein
MGGDVINKNLLFYKNKKKNCNQLGNSAFRLLHKNPSIICSVDNGTSRCMFINANPFNRDHPLVFLKYVKGRKRAFNSFCGYKKKKKAHRGIYLPSSPPCARHWFSEFPPNACGFRNLPFPSWHHLARTAVLFFANEKFTFKKKKNAISLPLSVHKHAR